jgi:Na+/proline symporter
MLCLSKTTSPEKILKKHLATIITFTINMLIAAPAFAGTDWNQAAKQGVVAGMVGAFTVVLYFGCRLLVKGLKFITSKTQTPSKD